MTASIRPLSFALSTAATLAACGGSGAGSGGASSASPMLEVVLEGLNNPASVSFSPSGELTVCDAGPGREGGNGRVLLGSGEERREYLTGFPTQYWKVGKDGEPDRFKLGPLAALWLSDGRLLVSNAGLADGVDHLAVYEAAGTADAGQPSTTVAPTSDDPADKGEGNLTGLCQTPDGRVFVAGQGADAKTWILAYDVQSGVLTTFASADEHGIEINSPMATLPWDDESILALYSGAGGVEDGLLVRWSTADGGVLDQWSLPGLADPMGMARVPGGDVLMVVDNNWDLREVRQGRLARVTLPEGAVAASVEVLVDDLRGPTACAWGPDGRLYVSLLGPAFDADLGSVVAFSDLE